MVPYPPRALVSSSGSTTSANQSPVHDGRAWCFTPREPLVLRPGAPRLRTNHRFTTGGRGASPPASPYSFVRRHHVCEPITGSRRVDVVLHLPRALVPSSRGTTSLRLGPHPAARPATEPQFRRSRMGLKNEVRPNGKVGRTSFRFCIDRKSSGAIAPLLFLHNLIKFYYFTFPLLFGAV